MGSQPVDIDRLRVTHGIYGAECALGMQGFCSFDYRCFQIFFGKCRKAYKPDADSNESYDYETYRG